MDPNSSTPMSHGMPPSSGPTGAPLDPKLQEAYNKVMNFSADPNAVAAPSSTPMADQTAMNQPLGAASPNSLGTPSDPMAMPQPLASPTDPLAQPQPLGQTLPADPASTPQPMTTSGTADPMVMAQPSTLPAPESNPNAPQPMDNTMAQAQSTPQPLGQLTPTDPQPALNSTPPSTGGSMFSTTPDPAPATLPTMAAPATSATAGATVVINGGAPIHDGQPAHGVSAKKKGGSMMPLILIFGAIVFIALYAIIWVKIFNIQVPFLPF